MSPREALSSSPLLLRARSRARSRARAYVGALVVAASLALAGPLAPAGATAPAASSASGPATAVATATRTVGVSAEAEQALVDRLTVEYVGAVGSDDVDTLVAAVLRDLRAAASPAEHLLRTTEAVCRRALTDYLARGTLLPT